MLVFIGISIFLLGIVGGVSLRMAGEMRREQTRAVLEGLLGAQEEFKAIRQQGPVNHDGTFPVNWSTFPDAGSSSERFVFGLSQVPSAQEAMIAALNSGSSQAFNRQFRDANNNGINEIYDRWGTEIEYRSAHDSNAPGRGPGRVGRHVIDDRGNTTTNGVDNNILPSSPFPYFISAGPDKQFGTDDDIITLDN